MRYNVKILTLTGSDGEIDVNMSITDLNKLSTTLSNNGCFVINGINGNILCVNTNNIDLMEFTQIG